MRELYPLRRGVSPETPDLVRVWLGPPCASGPRTITPVTESPEQPETASSTPNDATPADAETPATDPAAPAEKEWWEEAGMPWNSKPGRSDIACLAWFGVIGVFSIILIPTRAWLLGVAPDWLAMITGGRTAVAASGAIASTGEMPHWPWVLVFASILSLKFDWIYWWAGKLWGRGMIEVWAGRSKRAAKNYARAERWAIKLGPLGFVIAYIPIPLPLMQVVFVLAGATGMSLRRFLVYDYVVSTLFLLGYFWLGWQLGEPVVGILDAYARIAGYVAIGLIVVIMVGAFIGKKPAGSAAKK